MRLGVPPPIRTNGPPDHGPPWVHLDYDRRIGNARRQLQASPCRGPIEGHCDMPPLGRVPASARGIGVRNWDRAQRRCGVAYWDGALGLSWEIARSSQSQTRVRWACGRKGRIDKAPATTADGAECVVPLRHESRFPQHKSARSRRSRRWQLLHTAVSRRSAVAPGQKDLARVPCRLWGRSEGLTAALPLFICIGALQVWGRRRTSHACALRVDAMRSAGCAPSIGRRACAEL